MSESKAEVGAPLTDVVGTGRGSNEDPNPFTDSEDSMVLALDKHAEAWCKLDYERAKIKMSYERKQAELEEECECKLEESKERLAVLTEEKMRLEVLLMIRRNVPKACVILDGGIVAKALAHSHETALRTLRRGTLGLQCVEQTQVRGADIWRVWEPELEQSYIKEEDGTQLEIEEMTDDAEIVVDALWEDVPGITIDETEIQDKEIHQNNGGPPFRTGYAMKKIIFVTLATNKKE